MHMKKIEPPTHLVEQYGEFDLTCNGLAYYVKKGRDAAPESAVPSLAHRVIGRIRRELS